MAFKIRTVAAALIAAVIISGLICSCSQPNEDGVRSGTLSVFTLESEKSDPEFKDACFEGAGFIICSPMDTDSGYGDNYIDNDEYNGEAVNNAVVSRNLAVEQKYDVRIAQRNVGTGYASFAAKSGTVDFDLVYDRGTRLVLAAMQGVYYNFQDLKNVDLFAEYWTPSARDSLTVGGKLMIASCDISMNRMKYASLYVFNKDILDSLDIPYPYEYVEKNEWTFDKFIETLSCLRSDKNEDGLWSEKDVYAIDSLSPEDAAIGAGLCKKLTVKKDDGSYSLNVYSEELVKIFNKYVSGMRNVRAPSYINWTAEMNENYSEVRSAQQLIPFAQGHVAFHPASLSIVSDLIKADSDVKFGVVPVPKYSASQKEYYHEIDPNSGMFAVPAKAPDIDRTGTVLEYMAYESMKRLLPAYYEETVRTEHTSDPDGRDEKMLDVVRSGVYYRWTALYCSAIIDRSGIPWDPCSRMLDEMLRDGDFSTVQKKYGEEAQKSINDCFELFSKMDTGK